jgi:hypothetical protein
MDLDSVFAHDPYRTDASGTFLPIPIDTFFKSWKDCSLDSNPLYMGLIPALKIQDLSNSTPQQDYIITAKNGVNVRSSPREIAGNIVGYIPNGTIVHLVKYSSTSYCQLSDGGFKGNYIWGGYAKLEAT